MKIQQLFNIIGIIFLIVCLWLGLPLIKLYGTHPFESIQFRLMVILAFILILILVLLTYKVWVAFKDKKVSEVLLTPLLSRNQQSSHLIRKKIQKAFKVLKKIARKRGEKPYQLSSIPCFLVIGKSGSGKKTCIRESGFHFPGDDSFSTSLTLDDESTEGYQWWLAEEGLLFSMPLEESNKQEWDIVLNVLKKHRRSKSINSVIITCDLMDFVTLSEEEQKKYCSSLKSCLDRIYKILNISFPIYFLFTKTDQISGFQEFFKDLSLKEREQMWGINFNTEIKPIDYREYFTSQFNLLTLRLKQLISWKLSKSQSLESKERVYLFPSQLQFIKPSIFSLFKFVFSQPAENDEYYLEGLYFSSALQEGKALDFLAASRGSISDVDLPHWHFQERKTWRYFLNDTFAHFLVSATQPIIYSKKRAHHIRLTKRIVYSCTFMFITFNAIGLYSNYQFNKDRINYTQSYLDAFNAHAIKVESSRTFDDALAAILSLERAINLYDKSNVKWLLSFQIYPPYQIDEDIKRLKFDFLQKTYLPLVRDTILSLIKPCSDQPKNIEKLFEAYLHFAKPEKINKPFIKEIMNREWEKTYKAEQDKIDKLNYYLSVSLEHPIALAIDTDSIKRIQLILQSEDPTFRIYAALMEDADSKYQASIIPYSELGQMAYQVFTMDNPDFAISKLYTVEGYKSLVSKQTPLLIKEMEEEDTQLGVVDNRGETYNALLKEKVYDLYGQNFAGDWMQFLDSIKIKEASSFEEQVKILEILAKKDSPMTRLVTLLDTQTQDESLPDSLKSSFEFINQELTPQLSILTGHIVNLLSYTKEIQHAPDLKKASFDTATKRFSQELKPDPILDMIAFAETLPEPFKEWFLKISENTWKFILTNAQQHIEENWNTKIYQEFNASFKNKYPFNPESAEDVSLDKFTKFFGPKGEFETFFESYLQHFIKDPTSPNLQWNKMNGQSFNFDKDFLSFVSMAFSVQELFFKGKSSTPHLEMKISPQLLSKNATAVHLKLGNQDISYRHEAPQTYTIKWPFTTPQESQFTFEDFEGKQKSNSYKGDWAFFRWLSQGNPLTNNQGKSRNYEWRLGDYSASYEIELSDGSEINLSIFEKIVLP